LCTGVALVADAEWAVVIRGGAAVHSHGEPPELAWLLAFLDGSQHLRDANGAPSDLVWAHLLRSRAAVAAGRSDRPVHDRERTRVSLLARIADALVS
jgi:hypothetical protein